MQNESFILFCDIQRDWDLHKRTSRLNPIINVK